ncbi:hypothetical protein SCHPADRAFT_850679 [Schizopora paradoxa]|uniref:Vacuolar import and degradation protein 21 n=1 Tax=Schizopora paradoxa TaxID=27342 RepID=A0A0H2RRR6_9AGAM|nr:hypothetical protein SCHPADRAFT_850679 [Schizopora paradoxa]
MDEARVELNDVDEDGLGNLQWPAGSPIPELEDVRVYLADERISEKKAVTARRLETLREFFHFLKFGENGDDFPLLPQEPLTSDGANMDTLLAKYDLDAHPETGWFSPAMDDIVYNYASPLSSPPPEDEDVAPQIAEDATSTHGEPVVVEENDLGELDYPESIIPSSPAAVQEEEVSKSESEQEREEEDTAMDVDESHASVPPPPPVSDGIEPDTDEDAHMEEESENAEVAVETQSQEVQERHGSQEEDKDPLDIISLLSRASSISQADEPVVEQPPMTSDQVDADDNADDDADDEDDADMEKEEEKEESLEPPSQTTQTVVTSQEVRDESPSPSPSPKTPLPTESFPVPSSQMLASPSVPSKTPPAPVIVRISSSQQELHPTYSFVGDSPPSVPARPPQPSPPSRVKAATRYTLPPVSALPLELQKKGKPPKLRKRDRDKERSGSDNGKKDEWAPMGMARWAAILRCNPVFKRVSRASKCVSTRDWNISMQELKLIRVFDRIELLKDAGRWSFRQPKKQKAVALPKAHWDYLLDEMKWLQVDFREERRWKIALAYELAQEVLDWHEAGSWEERIRLGICTPWKRPLPLESGSVGMEVDADDTHIFAPNGVSQTPMDDNASSEDPALMQQSDDEQLDDEHRDQQDVDDALQPSAVLAEAANAPVEPLAGEATEPSTILPKIEEIEGTNVLHESPGVVGSDAMEVDLVSSQSDGVAEPTKIEGNDNVQPSNALKQSSTNPLMSQPNADPSLQNADTPNVPSSLPSEQSQALRSSIAALPDDALFVQFDSLALSSESDSNGAESSTSQVTLAPNDIDLQALFPELQVYGFIDLNPSEIIASSSSEGKKKADKKAEKDDPTKRVDETMATKLCPIGFFMHKKPTLVSALQPSRKWRKGKWVNLEESPVVSDIDGPSPAITEPSASSLFDPRKHDIIRTQLNILPHRDRRRTAEVSWSPAEENMLKKWADRYPNNWRLVADALNSSRIRSRADLRTPLECFERWKARWSALAHRGSIASASGSIASLDDLESVPPTPVSSSSQMTTRGVKRMAANANFSNSGSLTVSTNANFVESRKRKRHLLISDTMKRVSRQREIHLKTNLNTRKSTGPVHDTHLIYDVKQKFSPQELSRLKAEKDSEDQKMALARRQEEMRRQQMLRAQIYREQVAAHREQIAAQREQQQKLLNDPARAQASTPAAPAPAQQSVPQIRSNQVNISQQQQQAKLAGQAGPVPPMSPQALIQYQQARLAAVQAQAQAQAQQAQQQQQTQLQGQAANASAVNGVVAQATPFANRGGGASSPQSQHSSPPRSSATPVNAANFPRPTSAQRPSLPGGQALPMAGGQVSVPGNPIARHSNANMAAYFANGGNQLTPEQMTQMYRYQQLQQQHAQLQMQQQQQQQQNGFTGTGS